MDFSAIQKLIDSLQQALAEIESLKSKAQDAETLVKTEKEISYNLGFEAGVASVADKIYTQADLDAKISEAVDPIKLELENLKITFNAHVEKCESDKIEAINSAVSQLKADLKAKYIESQVVETTIETGFLDLLS